MAYNGFDNCGNATAPTGIKCIPDIAAPAKPFLTKETFEFATEADANDATKYADGIIAEDIFPLPMIEEMDNNSEEDTKYTSPITSLQRTVRKGKTIHQYRIPFDPSLHTRLQAFDGSTMRYFYADNNENMVGTSPDGTKWKGFEVLVNIDKWLDSDGSVPAFTPITLTFVSNYERETQVAVFEADFNVKALNGVLPATLTEVGTSSGTEVVVNVACGNVPVEGLLVADFIYLEAAGAEETITTATESTTILGQYTLAAAAFVTGTVNLRDVVTVGTEYYKGTAIDITIT